ncbi:MAG: transporter substrate-binding domain-containing protein [Proteobacteria bacterium]|nr:transporter substrate-binding domain-containing protein [Pseudomonadota bacterium]
MINKLKMFLQTSMVFLMFLSVGVHADALDDIIERGTLRIGVSLFVPWTMEDESGQLSGYEIDVTKKLAQDMSVKPKFIVYKWEDIIPALRKGEIDIIAGGMAITPARALKINFSIPYADSGISLATNTKMTRDIKSLEELNQENIIISGVSESVSYELANRLFDKANVKAFKTAEEATKAVMDGEAHAYVATSPQPEFLALKYPQKIDMPMTKPLISYKAGFGVNKGEQEWLNFLNAWVTAREADKWLSATHKHWFGSLGWRKEAR